MVTNKSKSTPTLGVEEDSVLSMRDVALIQLNESIRLFVDGRYLPAITLAGAAEEVLGKMVAKRGGRPAVHASIDAIEALREATALGVMGEQRGKEIIDQWNQTRNALKHFTVEDADPRIQVNLCDEAYWMIRRCLFNAGMLGLRVETLPSLDEWMMRNVH